MPELVIPSTTPDSLHLNRTHPSQNQASQNQASQNQASQNRPDENQADGHTVLTELGVQPWPDPLIDRLGHDPRSDYVERFWLGIVGPSTVLLMRRLANDLDQHPDGFTLDVTDTARSLGVGMRGGRQSPFMRTVDRVCRFGGARWQGLDHLEVRRKLPPLTRGQVVRLTPTLQAEHATWIEAHVDVDTVEQLKRRARHLALSLLELGEDLASTERQLHRWRFHPAIAHDAVQWAVDRHQDAPAAVTNGATVA
ncbi:MAG: hypothetical protein WCK41_12645 [Actinomycetes bacterium]